MAEAGDRLVPVADRPWYEGGAARLHPNWAKGMVACYHPLPDRIDMGMEIEKCAWCHEIRVKDGYWPPTTAPTSSLLARTR